MTKLLTSRLCFARGFSCTSLPKSESDPHQQHHNGLVLPICADCCAYALGNTPAALSTAHVRPPAPAVEAFKYRSTPRPRHFFFFFNSLLPFGFDIDAVVFFHRVIPVKGSYGGSLNLFFLDPYLGALSSAHLPSHSVASIALPLADANHMVVFFVECLVKYWALRKKSFFLWS